MFRFEYKDSFNPRPLCRERPGQSLPAFPLSWFQSTPPMQGATLFFSFVIITFIVSIHAPYAGSDYPDPVSSHSCTCFNPRPLCRERPVIRLSVLIPAHVSIHAPYAGSDIMLCLRPAKCTVSIHAPYAGSDANGILLRSWFTRFQSTPPMQGATYARILNKVFKQCFNPRPLCRERRVRMSVSLTVTCVSIHAPYAGSDPACTG